MYLNLKPDETYGEADSFRFSIYASCVFILLHLRHKTKLGHGFFLPFRQQANKIHLFQKILLACFYKKYGGNAATLYALS